MSLIIESQATPYTADPNIVVEIIDHLSVTGYEPLITRAKRKFAEVFGTYSPNPLPKDTTPESLIEWTYRRTLYLRYRETYRFPIAGDLFYTPDTKAMLYVGLTAPNPNFIRPTTKETQKLIQLEIGLIGDESNRDTFLGMLKIVADYLTTRGIETTWNPVKPVSLTFNELRQNENNKFTLASSITTQELELADQLEKTATRDLALVIRRSGGILASDLTKKTNTNTEQTQDSIRQLNQAGLVTQEYVIICKKTSNQLNRIDLKEKIDKMTDLNILCSCGNQIKEERIEELFSPTPILKRMLDQSFWMTARLVKLLKGHNIPDECILLNLQEGAEEIDAFVDLEGTLLMFELKDSEFSMGHAYPFSGRIGLNKPSTAIIISTKGIAPEVKEYLKRVTPTVEIFYIENMDEFNSNLERLIIQTRSARAYDLISQFEPMANLELPVTQMIAKQIGIRKGPSRSRPVEDYIL